MGLALLALSVPASAEPWRGVAEIEFQATSTLHDFSGAARAGPFPFQLAFDGPSATVGCTATVAVAQLDTRHVKRDVNMRKMFEANRFPLVVGVLGPVQTDTAVPSSVPVALTFRDRTTVVPATLGGWQQKEGSVSFDLEWVVSLREVGLSPPVLFGFIRVGDSVPVRVHVELEPAPP